MNDQEITRVQYDLSDALRDYSLQELTDGTEEALSGSIRYSRSSRYQGQHYRAVYAQDAIMQNDGTAVLLEASFRTERTAVHHTEVCLDDRHAELVRTYCTCGEFFEDGYGCRHVTALLMRYLMDRDGIREIRNSGIGKQLAQKTGIEDPFQPGVMRRTDRELGALLRAGKEPADISPDSVPGTVPVPVPQDKRLRTGTLSIEILLKPGSGSAALELKAGPGKHYVVKKLSELLKCYGSDSVYSFSGKVRMPAGRNHYTPDDRPVMDYLFQMYQEEERISSISYSYTGTSWDGREVPVRGRDLDSLMELLDGKKVQAGMQSGNMAPYTVDLSAAPRPVCLHREPFGATIRIPGQTILGNGMGFLYIMEEDRILRVASRQWKLRRKLSAVSAEGQDLYIQERDLPAICSALEPLARQKGQLETAGLDLAEYIPEIPGLRFYLDYPQEDLISCQVKAVYHKAGETEYNIYDTAADSQRRNHAAEYAAGDQVSRLFSAYEEQSRTLFLECDENRLYAFLTETIPALAEQGEVMVSDRMQKLKVRPAGEMAVGIQVKSGSLVVSLRSNTMDKNEIMEALSAYDRRKKYTRLKNGEFLTMDPEAAGVWEALSETFRSYGKKNPEAMKVPMFRALYLNEMLAGRDEVILSEGTEYKQLLGTLRQEESRKYRIPDSLKEILRGYQKDGFRWIKMLKDNGLGGILADDMGLGKTLQVLAFLLSEKESGKQGNDLRTLIISPASLVYNWQKEIETFTPQLTCRVISGSSERRKQLIRGALEQADIYITSYDLLKRDIAEYDGIAFANEIIDEAQYIKNQNTQTAKGVRLVDSSFRLALTGTPIENRLSELWSIFDYLMPGFLYSYAQFRREFESPIVNDHDEKALEHVRRLVHPFILRRLKKDVLKDLPDKIEETVAVCLEGEQRRLYDAYAERLRLSLDRQSDEEFHTSKIEILAEIMKLRQICCGPELFLDQYAGENAKMDACTELIRQAIDGGHKILVFSQFTSVLDELGEALSRQQVRYYRIDGSVSKEQRMKLVDAFARDDVPVFCISLKAGGTGLNLTAADIVIHYDPWWNVAAQNQATDRTHRIGQQNTVTVYRIIAEQTIEERIVQLQQGKAALAQDILSGDGVSSIMINKEELMRLL